MWYTQQVVQGGLYMKFKELQLSNIILEAIGKIGYIDATPIQEQAIPKILMGKDLIGLAQTGTGKTAAFSLPIIDTLIREYEADGIIKVLILSPTRELAIQIRDNILDYTKGTKFKCSVVLGGVNQESQKRVLKKGVDILVATPGRLLDLINQKKADMSHVKMLVLDEADTMLDMGFIKDIKSIIQKTPKERQTLLFSATMPNEIKELSIKFMNNPLIVKTISEEVTADNIEQELYYVDKANKTSLLLDLISTKEKPTTLIFTRTKHGANQLAEHLSVYDIKASVIHGNKTQSNRVKALTDFKNGKTRIMIATDIAARGIDINDLQLVINYDVPEKAELYVHRIGRTARAGKEGKALTLCSSAELNDLKAVEKLIGFKITEVSHKYPMVLKETKPAQKRRGSNRASGNSGVTSSKNKKKVFTQKKFSKSNEGAMKGNFQKRNGKKTFSKRTSRTKSGQK